MLSQKFQRKIYEAYKVDHNAEVRHGKYGYSIAYNACASIHTWIIRREKPEDGYIFLQPLDKEIN